MSKWKIPLNTDGSIDWYGYGKPNSEVDNHVFAATLRFYSFEWGRSSIKVWWEDVKTKRQFLSTIEMLTPILSGSTKDIKHMYTPLEIDGTFTFRKQGSSLFITRL